MSDSTSDESAVPFEGGIVLFAGGTDFENLGKKVTRPKKGGAEDPTAVKRAELYQDLLLPHQFASLKNIPIQFIATGTASAHCFAVDCSGYVYGWGKNSDGQLGLGDRIQRNQPVLIPGLKNIVAIACGRAHSVFVEKGGVSWACGENKFGQLGTGSSSLEGFASVAKVSLGKAVKNVAAGSSFTMWLTREGNLFAAGSGENGTLGDGSAHTFNSKSSSIKMEIEPQPKPKLVPNLPKDSVVNVACGLNHTICIDNQGMIYSWGCGDYGRLGHDVQKDEFRPKAISYFQGQRAVPIDAILVCGGTCSIISSAHGVYWWGKVKQSGDANMSPVMCYDLRGWDIRSLSAAKSTFGASSEKTTILWGQAIQGELAGGPHGKKTSACPAKCPPMEGLVTQQVACGFGFTVFLVDSADKETLSKASKFAVYDAPIDDPFAEAVVDAESKPKVKKPAAKTKPSAKRKRAD